MQKLISVPEFPYGAVYFRKSNPPDSDWERDYRTAAEDGMNAFRHWFIWSAIEIAPGVYDWDDYDRQLDLAAKYGIKTIIAEMTTIAPEWAFLKYSDARLERIDGRKIDSGMHGSCVVGGGGGLCLDHPDASNAAERFLRELVLRYKDHPGMGGYDVWNECGFHEGTCYCPWTAKKFRQWLKEKYGDLENLGKNWYRYSHASWDNVQPPRHPGPYPDTLDWLEFRIENAYDQMRWRVDLIRSLDDKNAITAHGVAATLFRMAEQGTDDWKAAANVQSYGYTWGSSRHGDEPWKQFHAVDLVRAASKGKPFWHAEAYAGPLWMQSNVIGKPRDEGRIASPEDIRYWNLTSFMLGARGLFYLRWRPLLDGPLFGAFGPYGMDGSRTVRSEMSKSVSEWVFHSQQKDLWKSAPIRGEVGIIYVPETQLFNFAQQGDVKYYTQSMQGAYRAFFDNNIQADWVHIDDIDDYQFLYLPYPVMLKQVSADKLKKWVEAGGILVCEGCPGYFGDRGKAGTRQPNLGLDEVFGVQENYVEFTPDLLDDLTFNVEGKSVRGGIFLQAYHPTSGKTVGYYQDGKMAVIDNHYGSGRTRLIGSMPGFGYFNHPNADSGEFFSRLLEFAGVSHVLKCSDQRIKTRLWAGEGGFYLWIANPSRTDITVEINIHPSKGNFNRLECLRGGRAELQANNLKIEAPARDISVYRLL